MKSYKEIERLAQQSGAALDYIGVTYLGYPIPLLTKGRGEGGVLLVGGVHAREYITSYLLFELMKEYCGEGRIDCVPALNIDGILLSRLGKKLFPKAQAAYRGLLEMNGGRDFAQWKANIRGVDLNTNFDAEWGTGLMNVRRPGAENYIGPFPESENETRAVVERLRKYPYDIVVAYHSKGEEIYFGFGEEFGNKHHAEKVADMLGYALKTSVGSAGGLKDYCVRCGTFGLTIEVGEDRFPHPYPMKELPRLINKHKGSLELFSTIGAQIAGRIYD
ncbi:MAG: M14 family zinc carboxypeptidase [Clostridia bacterium]|nr:M14 family zinc carboxypeptidase [Clostridia bacterium]